MPVAIVPDDPILNDFVFDLTLSEEHISEVQKTALPVEDGSVISDHVVKMPWKFSCVVLMTNTPIHEGQEPTGSVLPFTLHIPGHPSEVDASGLSPLINVASLLLNPFANRAPTLPSAPQSTAFQLINPVDRVQTMYQRLTGLQGMRKRLTVLTTRTEYESGILMSVSSPVVKSDTEDGVWSCEFTLVFEELRTVFSSSVEAPKPKEPRGAGNSPQGKKPGKKGPGLAGDGKSVALHLVEGLSNLFGGGGP